MPHHVLHGATKISLPGGPHAHPAPRVRAPQVRRAGPTRDALLRPQPRRTSPGRLRRRRMRRGPDRGRPPGRATLSTSLRASGSDGGERRSGDGRPRWRRAVCGARAATGGKSAGRATGSAPVGWRGGTRRRLGCFQPQIISLLPVTFFRFAAGSLGSVGFARGSSEEVVSAFRTVYVVVFW